MKLIFSSTTAPCAFAAALRDVMPNLLRETCLEWAAQLLGHSSWAELENSIDPACGTDTDISMLAPGRFVGQPPNGPNTSFGNFGADPHQLRTLVKLCEDEFGEVACDELLAAIYARYLAHPDAKMEVERHAVNPFQTALLSNWFFTEKRGEVLSNPEFQRALLGEEPKVDALGVFRVREGFRTRAQANAWFANATSLPLRTLDYMRKDDALVLTSWGEVHAVGPRVREGYNRGKHPVTVQDSLARIWLQDPAHRMRAGFAIDLALIADKDSPEHDCLSVYVHFAWSKDDVNAKQALLKLAPVIVGEELIRPYAQSFLWTRLGMPETQGRIRFLHDDEPLALEIAEALKESVQCTLLETYGCHSLRKYLEQSAAPRRTFSCY